MELKTKEVKLEWLRSRMFVGTDHMGNSLAIGYLREDKPEGHGVNPADLMLLAAASCSAYDVVQILEKGKQPLEGFKIDVKAEQSQESPYQYVSLHFNYIIKGDVAPDKIQRLCSFQRINTALCWPPSNQVWHSQVNTPSKTDPLPAIYIQKPGKELNYLTRGSITKPMNHWRVPGWKHNPQSGTCTRASCRLGWLTTRSPGETSGEH